jgi:hypothetical protein
MANQRAGSRVRALLAAVLLAWLTLAGWTAWAAAGPYAVDDSAIGLPGECKLETWISRSDTGDHLAVASPACVFEAVPAIEFGLNGLRGRAGGVYQTLVGPKFKSELVPIERLGVGIGVMVSGAYSVSRDRPEAAVAFVPFTVAPVEPLRVSLNLGWAWNRASHRHAATAGLGAEWRVHPRLVVIGETFGQDRNRWGKQIGMRPTLIEGLLDLDLTYGRNIDGTRSNWATVGAIVKF